MTIKNRLDLYDETIKRLEDEKKSLILIDDLDILNKHSPIRNISYKDIAPYVSISRSLYVTDAIHEVYIETEEARKTLAYYAIFQALPFHVGSWVGSDITFSEDIELTKLTFNNYSQVRSLIKDKADSILNKLTTNPKDHE